MTWLGIADTFYWKFNLTQAKDAQDCYEQCYASTWNGCHGWLYIPGDSSTISPPCHIVHGAAGPHRSTECPYGKPDIVFAQSDNAEDNFGSRGPCAGAVHGL